MDADDPIGFQADDYRGPELRISSADSDSPSASPPLPKMCGYCHRELPPGRPWFADESFGFTQEDVDVLRMFASPPGLPPYAPLLNLAARIAALLPPSPDPSR